MYGCTTVECLRQPSVGCNLSTEDAAGATALRAGGQGWSLCFCLVGLFIFFPKRALLPHSVILIPHSCGYYAITPECANQYNSDHREQVETLRSLLEYCRYLQYLQLLNMYLRLKVYSGSCYQVTRLVLAYMDCFCDTLCIYLAD